MPIAFDPEIKAFHDRFFAAWNNADLPGLERCLTTDTVYHPMNARSLIGREAVMASYRAFLDGFHVHMDVFPEVLCVRGNFAVIMGLYTAIMRPKAGGDAQQRSGRYYMDLEKSESGWQISRELTQPTADVPPA
jgi:ketosteroid isomerase-like protein